ncbi:MAG: hypothetical protein ACI35T_00960 [Alistipes sp.]
MKVPGKEFKGVMAPNKHTLVVKLDEGKISTLRKDDLCMGILLNSAMDSRLELGR